MSRYSLTHPMTPIHSIGRSDEEFLHLDLFSGLEGWRTDKELAYVGVDNDPKFGATITKDIRKVSYDTIMEAFGGARGGKWSKPILITASPVCTGFTVMQIGKNWDKDPESGLLKPKSDTARLGLELLESALTLIHRFVCYYPGKVYWIFENPRAAMRKVSLTQLLNRRTVTWCQYPEGREINTMKPTDLWMCSFLNDRWSDWGREPCKNGSPCHVSAPRGSRTGTQGMDKALAAKIPSELSKAIVGAIQ